MADISDITAAVSATCASTLYPTGVPTGGATVLGLPARVFEGWPIPEQLDADAKARIVNVSVYPVPGATQALPQVDEKPFVIVPAVHGMVPTINATSTVVTVSGAPTSGEYLTICVNKTRVYSRVGATLAAVMAALLADVVVDFPTATGTTNSITIPTAHTLTALVGAPATMGLPVHRQSDQIMVTVWAPDPATRALFGAALDSALKATLSIPLPDTTVAVARYQRTNLSDHQQNKLIYRRDLIYSVEYLSLQQFIAYEVTNFGPVQQDNSGSRVFPY